MTVLIGCPVYEGKAYSFPRWVEAIRRLTYTDATVLVADNSSTTAFWEKWHTQVPMVHLDLDLDEPPNRKIALSMEYLRETLLESKMEWWFNVEADVIVPPETLDFMLAKAKGIDWLSLPYPSRTEDRMLWNSFGCSLFSRHMMEHESFKDAPEHPTTDGWFYNKIEHRYRFKKLESALVPVHLRK